jgi:hypothetical protein
MQGPHLNSTEGAQEAYWLCSGLNSIGKKWLDPTQKNKPTKWPLAGDPITKTGWIEALTWPGGDCCMSVHAGPFDMEINKQYTFLVAHIVGLGTDYLNSIAVMKSYCRSVQAAVDLNFKDPEPAPAPTVKVGQLDTTIVLSWDDKMIDYSVPDKVNIDSANQSTQYLFQGFKLYQGKSATGPWTVIRQWDKDDGITRIWDYIIEPLTSELVYFPIEDGKDTGLSYNMIINKDYLRNTHLINGKSYYYALTTYSYNPRGIPRLLENKINPITAIPQKPVLNTDLICTPGDSLTVIHTGTGDGNVAVKVIDPTKITGHDYQVTFAVDDKGVTVWDVKDVTAGWYVINNQTLQVLPEELATNDAFPIADGIQVKVAGPPAGLKNEGFNYVPAGNRWLTSFSDAFGTLPLWPLEGWSGLFGWAKNFYGTSVLATELKNVEIRFAATDELGNPLDPDDPNISMAYRYLRGANNTPAQPGFASFIINKKSGYSYQDFRPICLAAYDMESNPPRRLAVGFQENNAAAGLLNGIWFPGRYDTEGGINATREFLYIFASDYSATPKEPYTSAELLMNVNNIDIMYVGVPSRRGEKVPQAGDKLILSANHINSPADIFAIKTAGYEKQSSLEIAKRRLNEINVVPNPYFALNTLETQLPGQFVTFNNLSEKCVIRIFSLSGQMVRSIYHENGTPFEKWDLLNEHGKSVGSGIYIVVIQVDNVGERVLKLAIINREL